MKVSVIVPVYNTGIYLEKCVKSLIEQSYSNIQIIMINDGSTDESLEVMNMLQQRDERIVVLDKKHEGVSAARNAGIEKADGDLLAFIDSDDWLDCNTFERLIGIMNKNDADAVFYEWTEEYSNGESDIKGNDGTKELVFTYDKIIETYLENRIYFRVSSSLMKREIIKNISFDTSLEAGEDMLYSFYALCNAKKVVYTNLPFYHRYNRVGSLSNRKHFFVSDYGRAVCTDYMVQYVKEYKPELLQKAYAYSFTFYMIVLNRILFYHVEDEYNALYLKIKNHLNRMYNEIDKPTQIISYQVYLCYHIFKLNKIIYSWIVRVYYRYIKRELGGKRQR